MNPTLSKLDTHISKFESFFTEPQPYETYYTLARLLENPETLYLKAIRLGILESTPPNLLQLYQLNKETKHAFQQYVERIHGLIDTIGRLKLNQTILPTKIKHKILSSLHEIKNILQAALAVSDSNTIFKNKHSPKYYTKQVSALSRIPSYLDLTSNGPIIFRQDETSGTYKTILTNPRYKTSRATFSSHPNECPLSGALMECHIANIYHDDKPYTLYVGKSGGYISIRVVMTHYGASLHAYFTYFTPKVAEILKSVFAEIERFHNKGLFHRDLKTENICIQEIGGEFVVNIIDFNLSMMQEIPFSRSDYSMPSYLGGQLAQSLYGIFGEGSGDKEQQKTFDYFSLIYILTFYTEEYVIDQLFPNVNDEKKERFMQQMLKIRECIKIGKKVTIDDIEVCKKIIMTACGSSTTQMAAYNSSTTQMAAYGSNTRPTAPISPTRTPDVVKPSKQIVMAGYGSSTRPTAPISPTPTPVVVEPSKQSQNPPRFSLCRCLFCCCRPTPPDVKMPLLSP